MRLLLASALLLASCSEPPSSGSGTIVSTNPCTDAILVELADPERIAAISHYSHDPGASSIAIEVARRFPATAGTAEEVIALAPALVIASSFTPPATREAFRRAGLSAHYLEMPATVEEAKAQVRRIAAAVGEAQRGEALVARIDRAVAGARHDGAPIPALLWHGGDGVVSGGGTLIDALLTLAGFRNASADYGVRFTGYLPLEHVVLDPPRVMLTPLSESDRGIVLRHRAIAASGGKVIEAEFPGRLLNCGGPTIVAALERLREIREGVE